MYQRIMKVKIITRNNDIFCHEINSDPQESGGEGNIYGFRHSRYGDCFLKIYLNEDKANKNREKILYLMTQQIPFVNEYIRYCWPVGAIYDLSGVHFIGFMMQSAFQGSRNLTILSNYNLDKTIADEYPDDKQWHNKYELLDKNGLVNRIKMLFNWSLAVRGLHRTGKYILVDIKPENVMATPDGQISIIDMDSIQVIGINRFYESTAFTPNYFPSEAYQLRKQHKVIGYSCDSFAIGCCFYSILTGTHPYTNIRLLLPYNNGEYTLISERIKKGLYLRGELSSYINTIDPPFNLHANYNRLSFGIQQLFARTFDNNVSNRPEIEEWCIELKKTIRK